MHGEMGSNYPHRYPSLDSYRLCPSTSSHNPNPDPTPTRRKLTGPYYLQNILNSDSESEVQPSSSDPPPHYPTAHYEPVQPPDCDAASYLRKQLCLPPDVPVDLWAIADPPDGQKPFASLPTLIKLAIHGSPHQRLTLQGICDALAARFSWFRTYNHDNAWKNSVRHNLSLNKVFRKVPRDVTQTGKGCYWELDLSRGEGHKRPRKRRRFQKSVGSDQESIESADNLPQADSSLERPVKEEDGVRECDSLILLQPYSPPPEERGRG